MGQTSTEVTVVESVEIGHGSGRPIVAKLAFPAETSKEPMPAVLWIHGGGWSQGTHKTNMGQMLARHGYFTASIDYRLSGEAPWPAQLEDCKLAVRWLRANAAKYNVDPNRIGIWGASAGGHLVSCVGTMGDQAKFEGTGGYEGVSSKVQAVVDYCGPVDFSQGSAAALHTKAGKSPDEDSASLVKLFRGTFKEKGDVWREASPLLYVTADDPPFLIVHGDADKSVVLEQSVRMEAALKKAGVSAELVVVKGGGHGMRAAEGAPAASPDETQLRAAVLAFFDKTLKK